MKRFLSQLLTGTAFAVIACVAMGGISSVGASVDITTCTVKNGNDTPSQPGFNELRRKVEQGFNRFKVNVRMCTEHIRFDPNITVKLAAPLDFRDSDCIASNDPAVCNNSQELLVDGGSGETTIDITGVNGACAIELHANRIKMVNLNIIATAAQIQNNQVICDHGSNNDLSGVKINGQSADTTPPPTSGPIATPTSTPSVLLTPTNLTAEIDPSSTTATLKVLLKWEYNNLSEDFNFDIERATKDANSTCGTFAPPPPGTGSINGKDKTYQDVTAQGSTAYCYRVRASRNSDHSNYSNVAEITTPDLTIEVPSTLAATGLSDSLIHVTWHSGTNPDGFEVERGNAACDSSSFTLAQTVTGTKRAFDDAGLGANTTFCYRVRAKKTAPGGTTTAFSLYSATALTKTLETGATPFPIPTPTATPVPTATPHPTATPVPTQTPPPMATPTPGPNPDDSDGDGIPNGSDNCPTVGNADQRDIDHDSIGDVCDPDADGDGVSNGDEIAQGSNPLNPDTDGDGVNDDKDNCPTVRNPDQADGNHDSHGDACTNGNGGGPPPNPSDDLPGGAKIGGAGGFCSLSMLGVPSAVPWFYLSGFSMLFGAAWFRRNKK